MKGFEVWNKIQELPAKAMNKLLKTMVNGPVKEAVEKVSELFRTFCKSAGKVAVAGVTTGLVGLALIGGGINVEAKGGTCKLPINRENGAKGERFINTLIGGINNPKKGFSYISPIDGKRKLRYPDIREEFIDASGNVTIIRATEVKVGYTTLTPRIREQIMRDGEIVRRGIYQKADWQFVKSPETKMSGASQEVKDLLDLYGITWNENKVTDITNY